MIGWVNSLMSFISPLSGAIRTSTTRKGGILGLFRNVNMPITPKTGEIKDIRESPPATVPHYQVVFWAEWFGSGRGVGNPKRDFIGGSKHFIEWIYGNEAQNRCSFASVQPFSAYETPQCLEKLFFDFDCLEDHDRAGKDAFDFASRLGRFYDVEPMIVFSGNKGYHVYVFLEKPFGIGVAKPHLKTIYLKMQKMILGKAEYETLDSSVIGDIAQLARIPFTHHDKTGELCRPMKVKVQLSPSELVGYYREHGLSFELCKLALYKVGEEQREKLRPRPKTRYSKEFDKTLRPCIQEALQSSHIEHKMRVAVVAELNAKGWSGQRIVDAFTGMSDFNRRKTETYVKHALKKRYSPFKCYTIQTLGGCLGSKCHIYNSRRR